MFKLIKKLKAFIDSKYYKWEERSLKTDEQKIKYHAEHIIKICEKYDSGDHISIWNFEGCNKLEFFTNSRKLIVFDLKSGNKEEEQC